MLTALLLASVLAVTLPPEPANHIFDQAQLLTPSERGELEQVFQNVQRTQGVKLGLVTLAELDDDPKIVSVRTLNYWNMSPDSVLLLVSLNPRKIYLQPGSNLQSVFDERTSTGITRSMVPAMKSSDYRTAILGGFTAIANALPTPQALAAPPPPVRQPAPRAAPQDFPMPSNVRPPAEARPSREIETVEAPAESGGHGFLIFLLIVGGLGVIGYLAYRQLKANERKATRRTGGFTPYTRPSYDPDTGMKSGGTVVNAGGSNDGLLTGLVVGSMLNQPSERVVERVVERPAPVPVPEPTYTPPPSPPSPPKHSSSVLSDLGDALGSFGSGSSSRGSGGGGSSWGSSSSDSSSGSGGGGSSWGGSDSGGSSSSGGGGGGSDW